MNDDLVRTDTHQTRGRYTIPPGHEWALTCPIEDIDEMINQCDVWIRNLQALRDGRITGTEYQKRHPGRPVPKDRQEFRLRISNCAEAAWRWGVLLETDEPSVQDDEA